MNTFFANLLVFLPALLNGAPRKWADTIGV